VTQRVGWGFIARYTLAYMGTCLLFLAPLLVTLALKVNSLVGIDRAPNSLALVAGVGALVAMVGNPVVGKLSDRTSSRWGMRSRMTMFLAPCVIGGFFILLFAVTLPDRRLDRADKPAWSLREVAGTFYVDPRKSPDFAWAFSSRFLIVLAYAFLTTYQAYYLLDRIGSAEAEVPRQIFLGTLVQSAVVVVASLAGGAFSDRTGRRKAFVAAAAIVYGVAMFVIALASDFNGYLVGMAVGGLGFGMYMAVDLALVADVLPDRDRAAKDLGVLNIAGALPSSIAPAIAPAILAIGGGSYGLLYGVAGICAVLGAVAILPVKGVR
jgi:MFS family permease